MRKFILISNVSLISILFFGCFSNPQSSVSTEVLERMETCAGDPMHAYALYIPKAESSCSNLPLVIILDPQGNGAEAIAHFKKGADKYGCILAASNLVKNNYPNYIDAINTLIEDVQNKYPAGNRVFIAGFSGGGRMALDYARGFSVSGLIVCGAMAVAEQLNSISCEIMGIAGLADFNFIETAQYVFNTSRAPTNLKIDFSTNSHEWGENSSIERALGYLIFSLGSKEGCYEKTALQAFCKSEKQKIESLKEEKNFLQAGIIARKLAGNEIFAEQEDFISFRNSLEFSAPYIADQERLKESIRFELAVRNEYNTALQKMGASWWENEISTLENKIRTDTDVYRKYAYRRIKGFLGVLCYSLAGKSVHGEDFSEAERVLKIYRMIEPQNPDMYFFSAILAYRQGDRALAERHLLSAKKAGFSDLLSLEREFPENLIAVFKE